MAERIGDLEELLKLRPLVFGAAQALQAAHRIDDAAALRRLRREAMRNRLTLEQVAAAILAGQRALPEAG